MVDLAEQDPEIGLVFSPRQVLIDPDSKSDLVCQSAYNGAINLHQKWSDLKPIQSGKDLLSDPNCLIGGLNKIGEPTTVLISKRVFEELGEFDSTLQQLLDVDMWFRIMGHYKIAFVNQTLSSLLIHKKQQTQVNIVQKENYKDYERIYLKLLQDSRYSFLNQSFKQMVLQKTLFNSQFYIKLITNLLNQSQENPTERVIECLQLVRQTLVKYWLTLTPGDLETRYSGEIRPIYQHLLNSHIIDQKAGEIEQSWIESMGKKLSQGLYSCDLIPGLMGFMLYQRAYELDYIYENALIPQYFFPEFLSWLFAPVQYFRSSEDRLKYINFQENLLAYIIQNLNTDSSFCDLWIYVAQCYLRYSQWDFGGFAEINHQRIYDYRKKMIDFLAFNSKDNVLNR
ncbi:MAG: hypothetical protein RSE13_14435 [Planktothrix sp. GU0601_MAG3]|nr:MAG: hypothetical protein RSE13_14435 [Planktothrix sp. GU0601_MAG3]